VPRLTYVFGTTTAAWTCLIVVLLLSGMPTIGQASAHGDGTLQLSGEAAGPYLLTVWTSPDPARVGEVHVTVGVSDPVDGAPILDATLLVEVSPLNTSGKLLVSHPTRRDSANKYLYEAHFSLPESGRHLVTVTSSGAQGSGTAQFELDVLPSPVTNWVTIWLASLAMIVAWLLASRMRRQSKSSL
jgi:hypothetical protein